MRVCAAIDDERFDAREGGMFVLELRCYVLNKLGGLLGIQHIH